MSSVNNTSTLTLELDDYFEELNAAKCSEYSNIEFDSKYFEVSNIEESLLVNNGYQWVSEWIGLFNVAS